MQSYVVFFRGINVGGKNILKMPVLRKSLEDVGLSQVRSYIQSGNIVFESETESLSLLTKLIDSAIANVVDFRPDFIVLQAKQFQAVIDSNPFPHAVQEPKTLHVWLLSDKPNNPDLTKIEFLRSESERFELFGCSFYLHAPEGIGRSRLAAGVEKALGVKATARNWRTVEKVQELLQRVSA